MNKAPQIDAYTFETFHDEIILGMDLLSDKEYQKLIHPMYACVCVEHYLCHFLDYNSFTDQMIKLKDLKELVNHNYDDNILDSVENKLLERVLKTIYKQHFSVEKDISSCHKSFKKCALSFRQNETLVKWFNGERYLQTFPPCHYFVTYYLLNYRLLTLITFWTTTTGCLGHLC